jgi:hypothetical protein
MSPTPHILTALFFVGCLSAIGGCGYTVGTPNQAQIRSVYVPVFQSKSYRRGVEFQLTEAVQKRIQQQTSFRLVKEPFADTRLTGTIVDIRKSVLGETKYDDPRELQLQLVVDVVWEDLRTNEVLAQQTFQLSPAEVQFISQAEFAPEVGQSLATAYSQSIDRMARNIVNMMESPW